MKNEFRWNGKQCFQNRGWYLLVDFRSWLCIAEGYCCNVLENRHFDRAVSSIEKSHQWSCLNWPVGDRTSQVIHSRAFGHHLPFFHRSDSPPYFKICTLRTFFKDRLPTHLRGCVLKKISYSLKYLSRTIYRYIIFFSNWVALSHKMMLQHWFLVGFWVRSAEPPMHHDSLNTDTWNKIYFNDKHSSKI